MGKNNRKSDTYSKYYHIKSIILMTINDLLTNDLNN